MVRVTKTNKKTGKVIYDKVITLKPKKVERLRTMHRGKYASNGRKTA